MLSCAGHWSVLSPPLRLALARGWDDLAREYLATQLEPVDTEAVSRWRSLVEQAHIEWTELRGALQVHSPQGIDLVRAVRHAGGLGDGPG